MNPHEISYLSDPHNVPVRQTLTAHLREAVRLYGRRPAMLDGDEPVSYQEVWLRSRATAAGLHRLGVEPGDRVVLIEPNSPAFVYAFLACAALGAVVVPIPPDYRQRELDYILPHASPRAIITVSAWRGFDFPAAIRAVYQNGDMPPVVVTEAPDAKGLAGLIDLPPLPDDDGLPDWESDAGLLLQYTSGTTGVPKGCYHSHNTLCMPGVAMRNVLPVTPSDRVMVFANMSHLLGLVDGMFLALLNGALLMPVPVWQADKVNAQLKQTEPTIVVAVPATYFQLRQISGTPLVPGLGRVRVCISAGTLLPDQTVRWIQEELGAAVINQYGLTEVSCCFNTRLEHQPAVRNGCVGLPTYGGVEAKVIDAAGRLVAREEMGEICLRAPWGFHGYYRNPEMTRELVDPAGWYHTGDVGFVDRDGLLHVLSRKKDIIVRGGQNIYPDEIEGLLAGLGYIEASAVVAAHDDRLGERTVAYVVPKDDASDITRQRIADDLRHHVARFKIPDDVVPVPDLPRTASGKVQRAVLREMAGEARGKEGS